MCGDNATYFRGGNVGLFRFGIDRYKNDNLFFFDLIDNAIPVALAFASIRIRYAHLENHVRQTGDPVARPGTSGNLIDDWLNVLANVPIFLGQLPQVSFELRRVGYRRGRVG